MTINPECEMSRWQTANNCGVVLANADYYYTKKEIDSSIDRIVEESLDKYFNKSMKFISYTKGDAYYEFIGEGGEKYIIPSVDVILVDDESGSIVVKNTASRRTIGYLNK